MTPKRTSIQPGQKLELDLTPVERKTILDHLTLLPPEYEAMLRKVHPEQPILLTFDELEDFSGYVAAEANHTKHKKRRAVLDSAYEKMAVLLDSFTDQETPAKQRTKRVIAAEREEADLQKKISDQAAFLATWAAGVLQAADMKRAKNRVLKGFSPGKLERVVLTSIEDVTPDVRKRLECGKEEFTLGEVGGMLMAVASELCVASVQQRVALLMVARSLMDALQEWESHVNKDGNGRSPRAKAPEARSAKKPRGTQQNEKKPGP